MDYPNIIIPTPNLSNFILLDFEEDKIQYTPELQNGTTYFVFTPNSVVTVDPDFLQGYQLYLALDNMSVYVITDPKTGNKARIRFKKLDELKSISRQTIVELNEALKPGSSHACAGVDELFTVATILGDKAYIYLVSPAMAEMGMCVMGPLALPFVDGKIVINADDEIDAFKLLDVAITTGISVSGDKPLLVNDCISVLTMEDMVALVNSEALGDLEEDDEAYATYLPEAVRTHGLDKVKAIFQREHYDKMFQRARKDKDDKEAYDELPENYQKGVDLWHDLQEAHASLPEDMERMKRVSEQSKLHQEYRTSLEALNIPGDY